MRSQFRRLVTMVTIGAFPVASLASAQDRDGTREQILRLLKKARIRTDQDTARVNEPGYEAKQVASIKELVRSEVLQLLGSGSVGDEALSERLRVQVPNQYGDAQPSAARFRLHSGEVVLIAYTMHTGPIGLPTVTAVVDSFQAVGDARFRFILELPSPLDGCEVALEAIASERANEAWALLHGRVSSGMQHAEKARLISFDGNRFAELWASERAMPDAHYAIERGVIKIHYLATEQAVPESTWRGEALLRVRLTPAGASAEMPIHDPGGANLRKVRPPSDKND